jgi:hypothetical protein
VESQILWITKTLTPRHGQAIIQRANQLVPKRKLRGLCTDQTIADILVLLTPVQHDSILLFAREFLTRNAVAISNKKLKIANPDHVGERSPRWMTVQGGLSRK